LARRSDDVRVDLNDRLREDLNRRKFGLTPYFSSFSRFLEPL
jgi:hypothetical protein